jgi:hypothetical protein
MVDCLFAGRNDRGLGWEAAVYARHDRRLIRQNFSVLNGDTYGRQYLGAVAR